MRTVTIAAFLALLIGPAAGQTAAPAKDGAKDLSAIKQLPLPRYRFTHAGDGSVTRLDGETGKVVICKPQNGKWGCADVPESGEVLNAQLKVIETDNNSKISEQLSELQKQLGLPDEERKAIKDEIAALRADIATLKGQLAPRPGDAAALTALRAEIADLKVQVAKQAAAQDERESQRAEIARLGEENAALKNRLSTLQADSAEMQRKLAELAPPRPPAPVPAPKSSELKMPSNEELAQARAAIAEAWRRVVEMMRDLRKDLTGKDDSVRL